MRLIMMMMLASMYTMAYCQPKVDYFKTIEVKDEALRKKLNIVKLEVDSLQEGHINQITEATTSQFVFRNPLTGKFYYGDTTGWRSGVGIGEILEIDSVVASYIESKEFETQNRTMGLLNTNNGIDRSLYNSEQYLEFYGNKYANGLTVDVKNGSDTITIPGQIVDGASITATFITNNFIVYYSDYIWFNDSNGNRTGKPYDVVSQVPGEAKLVLDRNIELSTGTYIGDIYDFQYMQIDSVDFEKWGSDSLGGYTKSKLMYDDRPDNRRNNKQGLVLFRTDNYLLHSASSFAGKSTFAAILDRYNIKAVWAFNEQEPNSVFTEIKKLTFWKSLQDRGHEIADHGPDHTNFSYHVPKEEIWVTASTPGVYSIVDAGDYWNVIMDTLNGFVTEDGYYLMMNRGQRLFKQYGLKPFRYRIEGGGQNVDYPIEDSCLFGNIKNGIFGGSHYSDNTYYHPGYNPPLDWIGKSEFGMNWLPEEALNNGGDSNKEGGSAIAATKKVVDQSARNTLSIHSYHIGSLVNMTNDYAKYVDSCAYFIAKNRTHLRTATGSEVAQMMYQSGQDPHINYMPRNPITLQCFEDNIDAEWGDTRPDGWMFGLTDTDVDMQWYTDGGSQGSKGYVHVDTQDTLYLHKLFGIEKGVNTFTIDVKDANANDTVYVQIDYYAGSTYSTLAETTVNLAFPSTGSWLTYSDEITFPYNTSYIKMYVWSRTDKSFIDEITLKKKY